MTARQTWMYRRLGPSTYEVVDRATGQIRGTVWRTRGGGWSADTPEGSRVITDYPGSRGVAAGLLDALHRNPEVKP